jgi:hypothetical protein
MYLFFPRGLQDAPEPRLKHTWNWDIEAYKDS